MPWGQQAKTFFEQHEAREKYNRRKGWLVDDGADGRHEAKVRGQEHVRDAADEAVGVAFIATAGVVWRKCGRRRGSGGVWARVVVSNVASHMQRIAHAIKCYDTQS